MTHLVAVARVDRREALRRLQSLRPDPEIILAPEPPAHGLERLGLPAAVFRLREVERRFVPELRQSAVTPGTITPRAIRDKQEVRKKRVFPTAARARRRRRLSQPVASWGGRRSLSAARRSRVDSGRLHGRTFPGPYLPRRLLRRDESRRGGPGRVRPGADLLRRAPGSVLGKPRSHAAQPPGARHRDAVPLGDLLPHRGARGGRAGFQSRLEQSGRYCKPIATEIAAASTFYRAEEYHQRYFEKRGLSHYAKP